MDHAQLCQHLQAVGYVMQLAEGWLSSCSAGVYKSSWADAGDFPESVLGTGVSVAGAEPGQRWLDVRSSVVRSNIAKVGISRYTICSTQPSLYVVQLGCWQQQGKCKWCNQRPCGHSFMCINYKSKDQRLSTLCVLAAALLLQRFQLCKEKGFVAADPGNTDAYLYDNGFNLQQADLQEYVLWLAEEAHKAGLQVGLLNSVALIDADVAKEFDFAINTACHQLNECDKLAPFKDGEWQHASHMQQQQITPAVATVVWCNNLSA